jgi:hypothetical protein
MGCCRSVEFPRKEMTMTFDYRPLSQIRLREGPFAEAQRVNREALLRLDTDRLLAPFRLEAGLPAMAELYGGWESSGLNGHTAGHVLSALAHAVAGDGDPLQLGPRRCRGHAGTEHLLGNRIATSFINFGAFLAFTAVNLCVIAYFIRNRRQGTTLSITGFIVLPILGAAVDFYLLTQLSPIAITIGCWLGLGVLYLVFLTKGFRKEPPEMRLQDRDGQPDEPTKEVQQPNTDDTRSTKQTATQAQPTEI